MTPSAILTLLTAFRPQRGDLQKMENPTAASFASFMELESGGGGPENAHGALGSEPSDDETSGHWREAEASSASDVEPLIDEPGSQLSDTPTRLGDFSFEWEGREQAPEAQGTRSMGLLDLRSGGDATRSGAPRVRGKTTVLPFVGDDAPRSSDGVALGSGDRNEVGGFLRGFRGGLMGREPQAATLAGPTPVIARSLPALDTSGGREQITKNGAQPANARLGPVSQAAGASAGGPVASGSEWSPDGASGRYGAAEYGETKVAWSQDEGATAPQRPLRLERSRLAEPHYLTAVPTMFGATKPTGQRVQDMSRVERSEAPRDHEVARRAPDARSALPLREDIAPHERRQHQSSTDGLRRSRPIPLLSTQGVADEGARGTLEPAPGDIPEPASSPRISGIDEARTLGQPLPALIDVSKQARDGVPRGSTLDRPSLGPPGDWRDAVLKGPPSAAPLALRFEGEGERPGLSTSVVTPPSSAGMSAFAGPFELDERGRAYLGAAYWLAGRRPNGQVTVDFKGDLRVEVSRLDVTARATGTSGVKSDQVAASHSGKVGAAPPPEMTKPVFQEPMSSGYVQADANGGLQREMSGSQQQVQRIEREVGVSVGAKPQDRAREEMQRSTMHGRDLVSGPEKAAEGTRQEHGSKGRFMQVQPGGDKLTILQLTERPTGQHAGVMRSSVPAPVSPSQAGLRGREAPTKGAMVPPARLAATVSGPMPVYVAPAIGAGDEPTGLSQSADAYLAALNAGGESDDTRPVTDKRLMGAAGGTSGSVKLPALGPGVQESSSSDSHHVDDGLGLRRGVALAIRSQTMNRSTHAAGYSDVPPPALRQDAGRLLLRAHVPATQRERPRESSGAVQVPRADSESGLHQPLTDAGHERTGTSALDGPRSLASGVPRRRVIASGVRTREVNRGVSSSANVPSSFMEQAEPPSTRASFENTGSGMAVSQGRCAVPLGDVRTGSVSEVSAKVPATRATDVSSDLTTMDVPWERLASRPESARAASADDGKRGSGRSEGRDRQPIIRKRLHEAPARHAPNAKVKKFASVASWGARLARDRTAGPNASPVAGPVETGDGAFTTREGKSRDAGHPEGVPVEWGGARIGATRPSTGAQETASVTGFSSGRQDGLTENRKTEAQPALDPSSREGGQAPRPAPKPRAVVLADPPWKVALPVRTIAARAAATPLRPPQLTERLDTGGQTQARLDPHVSGWTASPEPHQNPQPQPQPQPQAQGLEDRPLLRAGPVLENRRGRSFDAPREAEDLRPSPYASSRPVALPATNMMPEAAALRARNAEGGASGDGGALQAPDEMLLSVGPSSMAPEERGMSAPTRELQADLLHHPKAAVRQMAQQVAAAARSVVDTAVEVRMRPEELGHVRMAVHHMEGGVFLHITAERAETLDLMRRHADPLMKELQEEGYGDVRLLFNRQDGAGDSACGRDRGTGQERTDGMRASAAGPVAMDPAPPPAVNDPAVQAGLDLRL